MLIFFEPGWKIPLPRSPRADFFDPGLRNPPPQGAKRPGGAAEGGARGIFETVSKKSAPGEGDFQKYFKKSAPGEGHLFLKLHPGHFFEMALGGVILRGDATFQEEPGKIDPKTFWLRSWVPRLAFWCARVAPGTKIPSKMTPLGHQIHENLMFFY